MSLNQSDRNAKNEIALPPRWTDMDITQHGSSSWSTGYKLKVEKDKEEKEYFLKVCKLSHTTYLSPKLSAPKHTSSAS
jgi:hypothetical protein